MKPGNSEDREATAAPPPPLGRRHTAVRIVTRGREREPATASLATTEDGMPRSGKDSLRDGSAEVSTQLTTPHESIGSQMLAELRATGFVGMWKDRKDIRDSSTFARQLRQRVQTRADRRPADK
jgi:hypothetical protein